MKGSTSGWRPRRTGGTEKAIQGFVLLRAARLRRFPPRAKRKPAFQPVEQDAVYGFGLLLLRPVSAPLDRGALQVGHEALHAVRQFRRQEGIQLRRDHQRRDRDVLGQAF
jgi:hypothetical protein